MKMSGMLINSVRVYVRLRVPLIAASLQIHPYLFAEEDGKVRVQEWYDAASGLQLHVDEAWWRSTDMVALAKRAALNGGRLHIGDVIANTKRLPRCKPFFMQLLWGIGIRVQNALIAACDGKSGCALLILQRCMLHEVCASHLSVCTNR